MAKRKASSKFDFDVLRASVNAKDGVNVQDIVMKEYDLTEDEILQVLEVKLTIEGLYNLCKAIQHVSANVTCVVEGTAMWHKFIFITCHRSWILHWKKYLYIATLSKIAV